MQAVQKICQWCICYDCPMKVDKSEKEKIWTKWQIHNHQKIDIKCKSTGNMCNGKDELHYQTRNGWQKFIKNLSYYN